MIDCMMHERFYKSGKSIVEDIGFYGGWVNIKNSICDCMPIVNKQKNLVILFFGENIKDREYINRYKKREKNESRKSGIEYLIDLYEEKKSKFYSELNGFYHGVIVDLKNKKIIIFIDRYGMMRLYYYFGKDEFIYSSEAKAILRIRPFLKNVDMQSLGEYFSCGCVLNNRTLFKDIFLLPGGAQWEIDTKGNIDKKNYFSPKIWEQQSTLNEEEFGNALGEKLIEIVPKYLKSEQKIGLSLTGGLDTRMILAVADISHGSLPCFTYGGMYRDSYDVKVSKKISKACGQTHHVLRLDKNFFKQFSDLAEKAVYFSDGCMNVTGAPNLYVAKLAREIAAIRLTGNYGQEVLRRCIAFKPNPQNSRLFSKDFFPYIRKAEETYYEAFRNQNNLTFALFKQAPWFQFSRYAIENSQMIQRSPFMDNELVELVYRAPIESLKSEDSAKKIIFGYDKKLGYIMTDLGKLGNLPSSAALVVKTWRYFLFKMEWYYNHRLPRFAENIDSFLSPLNLEQLFIGRNKYYHMRVWFRDELSDYLKQVLLDSKCAGRNFINREFLTKVLDEHINKNRSNTDLICTALSAELMYRKLID